MAWLVQEIRLPAAIGQVCPLQAYLDLIQLPGPHTDAIPRQFSYCLGLCAVKTLRRRTCSTFQLRYFATINRGCSSQAAFGRPMRPALFLKRHKQSCVARFFGIHVENKVVWEKKGESGQCSEERLGGGHGQLTCDSTERHVWEN